MGEAALEGLDGVEVVTKGFKGFREINTVTYDDDAVTIDEMTTALKKAGTYRGMVKESD